ncbi:MAG: metallophosphoesterase [Candidatus Pristimantibacillus lignocellulolyticus]|uniref:Metallophosphoesterase n=1 Tax=Candidatus Pristimantibacillus lignocellulolyticus TaxID=2994561 RepID=A0A9J6ZFG0_9BACL|nr:MAG: metallophosphoesterase [Candidatus Pristimantibacillus lignocellulolyticus]
MQHGSARRSSRRLLAISDIHGQRQGFLSLLEAAQYDPHRDQLVILGDYIEAGEPITWRLIDLVHQLVDKGAIALPGNHELKLATLRRGSTAHRLRYLRFIRQLPSYYMENGYLFVHAGVRPGLQLQLHPLRELTEIRESFTRHPLSTLRNKLDTDVGGTAGQRIVFGHTPTFKLGVNPGSLFVDDCRIGIDTGAKHGYKLSLVDLTNGLCYSCSTNEEYRASDVHVYHVPGVRNR